MKLSASRKKLITDWSLTAVLTAFMVYFFAVEHLSLAIGCSFAFLVRFIFLSRKGSRALAEMRRNLTAALRNDLPYHVDRCCVICYTFMTFSPFYLLWVVASLFLLVGGLYAYLLIFIPAFIFSFVLFRLVLDTWKDLEMRPALFWLLQLASYILSLVPTFIIAAVTQH